MDFCFPVILEPSVLALMQMTPGALLLIAGGSVAVAKDLFFVKTQEELPVEDAVDDGLYSMFSRLNQFTFISHMYRLYILCIYIHYIYIIYNM